MDGNTLTGVLSKGDKTLADYAANSNGVSVAKALSADPALLGALADATKDEVRKTLSSLANDIHVTANAMTVANGQSLAVLLRIRPWELTERLVSQMSTAGVLDSGYPVLATGLRWIAPEPLN